MTAPEAPPSSEDWSSLLDIPADSPPVAPTPPPAPPSSPVKAAPPPTPQAAPPSSPSGGSAVGSVPDLATGARLRAIPEKQPATPRGWNVTVLRTDNEGIWIQRVPGEADPLPVSPKEILSLVLFDERRQVTHDCPVIRIKPGNPEQVLVGLPLKSAQEKSKLDSIGGRQHFRIETQLPVEVKIVGSAAKGVPPLSGHTRDISRGGLALVIPRSFESGKELDVRVLSWNFPLQIRAKVVRCDEGPNGRYVVAVAFPEDMSGITRDLINHFIMENQRGRT